MTVDPPETVNDLSPSKSQRKRDARALFELGRDLVRLDNASLERLPLDAGLRDAVLQARRIKSHIAHKRQLQFIARLLRATDPTPLQEALDLMQNEARLHTARQHRIEDWRDRLLAEGDEALQPLVAYCEAGELQLLRQLIRNAKKESERGKPPAAARKLFRLLRDIDAREALPPA